METDVDSLPGPDGDDVDLRHRFARGDGIDLHCVEASDPDGPLVVLLHGFPEYWYTWRRQLPALAAAGYRVLAPDTRGYNRSGRPAATSAYRMDRLVGDVVELVATASRDGAAVVGHDFGGLIAWELAIHRPDVVERVCALNAPHPAAYRRELRSPAQLRRSWYAAFFQAPRVPEWALRLDDYRAIERLFERGTVAPDAFTGTDVERYKVALDRPGALTAAIDYYRANRWRYGGALLPGYDPDPGAEAPIGVPARLVWGLRDGTLSPSLTRGLEAWVPGIEVERFRGAGHWVHLDAPGRVTRSLLEFLE